MITTHTLPSTKNFHDTIFLIGLMTIMLIVVVSFLVIRLVLADGINASLNNDLTPPPPNSGIIEEQV